MPDINGEIADKIRGVMSEKRSNQDQIAGILGLSRQSVNARFRGRAMWAAWELQTLSAHWAVPVSRFYPETSSVAVAA